MSLLHPKERIPTVDAPPPPKGGPARAWFLCRTHFGKLVTLNLLLLVFCIPVVTIPAAIAAADRVCLVLWREGNCFLWQEFWEELKGDILRALPIGLVGLTGGVLLYVGVFGGGGATAAWLPRVLLIAGGLWAAAVAGYGFVMLALMRLSLGAILKNALLMTMLAPKSTLTALLAGGGMLLAGGFFLPYTLPLWLFLWCALERFSICALLYGPVMKRVLSGEERAENGSGHTGGGQAAPDDAS